MTWVACGRNYSDSFAPNVLKLCRCFCHGLKMCISSLVGATYPTVFHLSFSTMHTCSIWSLEVHMVHMVWDLSSNYLVINFFLLFLT